MKQYILVVVIFGMIIMSGCSQQPSTTPLTKENIGSKDNLGAYGFAANHSEGKGIVHKIDLTPHTQSVRFFDNASPTTLRSYGTGTEPTLIRATQGDILEVKVTNTLSQETSVHWHGIRVPNDQDGVPGVTQEPIAPGATYTYRFPVNDEGTFLFHPHINTVEQMGRGLYGLLVVEPKDGYPFAFDEEFTWAIKDYRINQDGTLNEIFTSMMDFNMAGRLGNIMTINNVVAPTFDVQAGSKVLIRLVNSSNARIYNFDLTARNAMIVGTDGGFISNPYKAGLVQIGPGERINLIVSMPENTLTLRDTYYPNRPGDIATIRSSGKKKSGEINIDTSKLPVIPDRSTLVNHEPDEIIHLGGIGVSGGDKGMGMMGGGNNGRTINDGIRPETNKIIRWQQGKHIVVRLQNDTKRDHPIHLHGDFFQVLGINGQKAPWHGWKDTVNVPAKGYLDLAIIPTNPGTRMFHCHIIEHAHNGMMTTVIVE